MTTSLAEIALDDPAILEWDVLEWAGVSPGKARVVHVAPDRSVLWILRLDGAGWPEAVPYAYAGQMVESGAWTHVQGKPPVFPPVSSLTAKQQELLSSNWSLVGPLLQNIPDIFDKRKRVAMAEGVAIANQRTRRFVMNLLKRGFENGMSRDSVRSTLVDNGRYERVVTSDSRKVGPAALPGTKPGLPVDDEMKRFFANALRLHWSRNKRMDLKAAFDLCLRLYFMDLSGGILEGGTHAFKDRYAEHGPPTYGQFIYWAPKVVDLEALTRRKLKPRVYDQRNRPILKTSNSDIWGPGGRFQIDATVLDVYIRSRRNGRQVIGRPTLYVVIDVFSRMIVGIYIGLESPSWVGAMMALANCVEDKVEYCRGFGVEIGPDDWLTGMIPAILLGDRGELERLVAENMINLSKIKVETAAAYMGDWKGIVESCFRTLPAIFKPYVDGYVETDFRERGVRDYRADAALDLDDLGAIVIDLVLFHNNHHVLTEYDRHERLSQDEVPSIPRELWRWGVANLSGVARRADPEAFRFGLMPQAAVSITEAGVLFEGRYYDAPELRPLFEKARRKGAQPGRISYDKRRTDVVLVHHRGSEKGFVVAKRIQRTSAPSMNCTAWEEHGAKRIDRAVAKNAAEQEALARADTQGRVEAINERARRKSKAASSASVRNQVTSIRRSRAKELEIDRQRESRGFVPDADVPPNSPAPQVGDENAANGGNVVQFPGAAGSLGIPDFAARNPVRLEDDYD